MRGERKVAGRAMSPSACRGRLPVREHLQPRPTRKVVIVDDAAPETLQLFPNIVAELNGCVVHVCRPDGWIVTDVPLDEALARATAGEE
jgi:hypothetical protein